MSISIESGVSLVSQQTAVAGLSSDQVSFELKELFHTLLSVNRDIESQDSVPALDSVTSAEIFYAPTDASNEYTC